MWSWPVIDNAARFIQTAMTSRLYQSRTLGESARDWLSLGPVASVFSSLPATLCVLARALLLEMAT